MDSVTLVLHVAAGSLAILAGYVATAAAKGARLHRRAGMTFVYAMVVMGLSGFVVALMRDIQGSLTGGPLAAYFVITALTTVRPGSRRVDLALIAVPLAVCVFGVLRAVESYAAGRASVDGVPNPMILLFAAIALLAAIGDVRSLRVGGLTGSRRIARHLWRMCFAFWIATGSFFLGQMDEFPARLQNAALLALPALFPLLAMAWWLWRVRRPARRNHHTGVTVMSHAGAAISARAAAGE